MISKRSKPAGFVSLVAIVLAACGGTVDDGAQADAAGRDTGSQEDTGQGCPTAPPTLGASCATATGMQCEYGSNPEPYCNALYACADGVWESVQARGSCDLAEAGVTCPASFASVPVGTDCSWGTLQHDPACSYPEGVCYCIASETHPSPAWSCVQTPDGCSQPPPDLGQPCTQEGLACDYGGCSTGAAVMCSSGVWQTLEVPCTQ